MGKQTIADGLCNFPSISAVSAYHGSSFANPAFDIRSVTKSQKIVTPARAIERLNPNSTAPLTIFNRHLSVCAIHLGHFGPSSATPSSILASNTRGQHIGIEIRLLAMMTTPLRARAMVMVERLHSAHATVLAFQLSTQLLASLSN